MFVIYLKLEFVQDKTVIVADFGLARIVKRTGVSGSLERSQRGSARERKKRYTVIVVWFFMYCIDFFGFY